ncbi:hypothetical protein ACR80S_01830 [Halomonas sp. MA07-2]|uniref:hypothetical protein n=1 Tax=unclassified Halomonas TaxID=2609666 RepID=UPI003EEE9A4B
MPILRPLACLLPALLPLMPLQAQPLPPPLYGGGQVIAHELDACLSDAEWQPEPALGCAQEAEVRWEEEVERLGARLDKVLGREARLALEASRAAWEQGRAADLALVEAYHGQLAEAQLGDPDLLPLSRQLHRSAVWEQRARYLQRLLDGLEERLPEPIREAP